MTDDEVIEGMKASAAALRERGATDRQLADACCALGLSIAEVVAGPLEVAHRCYVWALGFASRAGLSPDDLGRTKH